MQSIQEIKIFLFVLVGCLIFFGCESAAEKKEKEFEEKGPKKQESTRPMVDVRVISRGEKTEFEATIYHDISGIVEGKVVRGFGRKIIQVKDVKLDDIELEESKEGQNKWVYKAEISGKPKEYVLTFSPNENLQASHKIKINPIHINDKNVRLKRGENIRLKLSREATGGEPPGIVLMKNEQDKFVPTTIRYVNQVLDFSETSLDPFKNNKSTIRVTFETIPSNRDENKSLTRMNYVIEREVEIF